jgi:hypothetical protein
MPMNPTLPPGFLFHRKQCLLVYRPRGTLNEHRVNGVIAYLEKEEDAAETPFNRFTDLSKVDALDLDVNAMIRISLYRRLAYGNYPPIKSAFYVTTNAAAELVKVHVLLTNHSSIKARMFHNLDDTAHWLGVSRELLELEVTTDNGGAELQ